MVLDPFVGSGTALVEGALLDRTCIGVDVDPVAVAVARAKTRRYDVDNARAMSERLLSALEPLDRGADMYVQLAHAHIPAADQARAIADEGLCVPAIPNLHHWFRRYVVVDLARIHREIEPRRCSAAYRDLLRLLFASIIRNSSNAYPVPFSFL